MILKAEQQKREEAAQKLIDEQFRRENEERKR